jgi:hypothetical protein
MPLTVIKSNSKAFGVETNGRELQLSERVEWYEEKRTANFNYFGPTVS